MHIFDVIYKKENTLQCQFSDSFIHPRYFGAEFPIGQHLITAIGYDKEYVKKLYNDLIRFYINFLDTGTEAANELFLNTLFKIDDYCIYFHEPSIKLLTLIEAAHPCYSLCDVIDFVKELELDMTTKFSNQFSKIKTSGRAQTNEIFNLWNIALAALLDKFDSLIDVIKSDIFDICNTPSAATGFDKLTYLDRDKKTKFFEMEFPMRLRYSLDKSANSKFFLSDNLDAKNIVYSIAIHTAEQLMYYDLFTVLEIDLPIKICKNCNMPFIPKGRIDSLYCDRIMPGFKHKCSAIGALNTYKSKQPDIEAQFYAARKRYATRVSRNPSLKTEFEVWKIKSREKLTAHRNGKISADEFKKWFMDDEWTRI